MLKRAFVFRTLALAPFALLAGCWSHSFPQREQFIVGSGIDPATAPVAELFVDPNGTFYPSGWKAHLRLNGSWRADSLLNDSNDDPAFRRLIEAEEPRQLAQIAAFGAGKRRLFILVHGYNNTVAQASAPFDAITAKLDLRADDGVVRFYWDGLTGSGIGGAKTWFNATGNSQLAGSRGLRRVLDQFASSDIYLIGHSRGASVILSALGNPVYDPRFLTATQDVADSWGGGYARFLSPPSLRDRGNRIRVLVMAPAVDRIDFCDASEQPTDPAPYRCAKLRPLGAQVLSFRYTVNPKDPVLNKFVGLSRGFNPTGLGLRADVGVALGREYPQMRAYPLDTPVSEHGFGMYVANPAFGRMLADEAIARPGAPAR
jgi:hypothetical protein